MYPYNIEAAIGGGWSHFSGHTVNNTEYPDGDRAILDIATEYLQCSYFFRFVENQTIIPYLGGGFDVCEYNNIIAGNGSTGITFGYHGLIGMRLSLGWGDSVEEIKNTYFVLEARRMQIDNLGELKLDPSGQLYRLGLLWEF